MVIHCTVVGRVCDLQSRLYLPWIGQPAAMYTNASAIQQAILDMIPYYVAWSPAQMDVIAAISGIVASSNMLAYEVLQQVGRCLNHCNVFCCSIHAYKLQCN
jgi:hypothetical protein